MMFYVHVSSFFMIPTVLLFQVQELFQLATGFGDSFRFQVSPLLISKRSQDNTADLGEKEHKTAVCDPFPTGDILHGKFPCRWRFESVTESITREFLFPFLKNKGLDDTENQNIWANYNDLSRGHLKWWFSKGIPPKSP